MPVRDSNEWPKRKSNKTLILHVPLIGYQDIKPLLHRANTSNTHTHVNWYVYTSIYCIYTACQDLVTGGRTRFKHGWTICLNLLTFDDVVRMLRFGNRDELISNIHDPSIYAKQHLYNYPRYFICNSTKSFHPGRFVTLLVPTGVCVCVCACTCNSLSTLLV